MAASNSYACLSKALPSCPPSRPASTSAPASPVAVSPVCPPTQLRRSIGLTGYRATGTYTRGGCSTARRHVAHAAPLLRRTAVHASAATTVGNRIAIAEDYPGLKQVHADPDVFVIENFLDDASCADLIDKAKQKGMSQSPVAYAGWTDDIQELLGLAAKGPVAWFAIGGAWYQAQGQADASVQGLVLHAITYYVVLFVVAALGVAAFTKRRADGLQSLRTSSSTTLDDMAQAGTREFVARSADLFGPESSSTSDSTSPAAFFESPTIISYEKDQVLAPHFDANRSADTEDKDRGGQTLATLLVYLNDVSKGGNTRFGRLEAADDERQAEGERNLAIQPRKGDALLFFPADARGAFDERTEHEGCPTVDEKWIARIWRHADRVPPPFGLTDEAINKISKQ